MVPIGNVWGPTVVLRAGVVMSGADWTIIDTETTGIAAPIYTVEIAAQRMRGLVPVGKPFQVFLNHEVDVPREARNYPPPCQRGKSLNP